MNANELADLIEFDAPIEGINKEAAAVLRQQQFEIEMLRNQLWHLKSEPWGFDRKAQEK
jgi:hypothetical protein